MKTTVLSSKVDQIQIKRLVFHEKALCVVLNFRASKFLLFISALSKIRDFFSIVKFAKLKCCENEV